MTKKRDLKAAKKTKNIDETLTENSEFNLNELELITGQQTRTEASTTVQQTPNQKIKEKIVTRIKDHGIQSESDKTNKSTSL